MEKKIKFTFQCLKCAHKTGTKKQMCIPIISISLIQQEQQSVQQNAAAEERNFNNSSEIL